MDKTTIYSLVNDRYSQAAENQAHKQPAADNVARAFGYSHDELAALPEKANLGLSCGNPIAMAHLAPAETVVDFGSGGGMDAILAAARVRTNGKVFGIDDSEPMIRLARGNAFNAGLDESRVLFVKAPITDVPLNSGIADCVISNCVINLVPDGDKPSVFREAARLLKPGGRLAVSDILAKQPLPDNIRKNVALIVGCVAGASLVREYERWMAEAGFEDIVFLDSKTDLNVWSCEDGGAACCAPTTCLIAQDVGKQKCESEVESNKTDLNQWVGSYKIFAIKTSKYRD